MLKIETMISQNSEFEANRKAFLKAMHQLDSLSASIRVRDQDSSVTRHRSRGKLYVRDRIDLLLDPESDFLEIGLFAAQGL